MGYCATVTLHDKRGEALHTIRYGRMSEGDVRGLVHGMRADVVSLLKQRPDLKVVLLADGAPELWARLGRAHLNLCKAVNEDVEEIGI